MTLDLSFPMDPNLGYLLLLKEVSWTTYALLCREKQSIHILGGTRGKVQVLPGLKVGMNISGSGSSSSGDVSLYKFEVEFEGTINPFMPLTGIRDGEAIPRYLITKILLVDHKDTPVNESNWTFGQIESDSKTGTSTISGCLALPTFYSSAHIHFVVAVNPYEVKLPFVLTDIPVPTF
jgi:hypothetical protein